MTKQSKTKTASFYHFFLVRDGKRDVGAEADWPAIIEWLQARSFKDRTFDGFIYDCSDELDWMMGIHEPLDSAYMSIIDRADGSIGDAMDVVESSGREFAHSTAVAFMEDTPNCAAISKGKIDSPSHKAIVNLLNTALPRKSSDYWRAEPVVAHADIEALMGSRGATLVSGTIETNRTLFAESSTSGIFSHTDQIADLAGGDLELTMTLKLDKASDSQVSRSKLRQIATQLAPRFIRGRKASAVVDDNDGIRRAIALTTHSLSTQFELATSARGSIQFSELMRELHSVRAEMENRVQSILEG